MDFDALTIMRIVGLINFLGIVGLFLLFLFKRTSFWTVLKALLLGAGLLALALFGLRRLLSWGGKVRGLR